MSWRHAESHEKLGREPGWSGVLPQAKGTFIIEVINAKHSRENDKRQPLYKASWSTNRLQKLVVSVIQFCVIGQLERM